MKRKNDYTTEVKFNWWIPVIGVLIIVGVIMFAPPTVTATYDDTSHVRLLDAVAVEFDWSAEYPRPALAFKADVERYEDMIRMSMNNGLRKSFAQYNSIELFEAEPEAVLEAMIIEPVTEDLSFTVTISKLRFEGQFLDIIDEKNDAETALKEALIQADSARKVHEELVAEEMAKTMAMSEEEREVARKNDEEYVAVVVARKKRDSVEAAMIAEFEHENTQK